jgi:DNA-binding beta-propeller fold protein YncE
MSGISTKRRLRLLVGVLSPALIAGACGRLKDGDLPPGESKVAQLGVRCGSGNICTVAGTGVAGDGADLQDGLDTRMYLPQDVTFGPDGRLYIADWNNHRIRALREDLTMQIVAGIGELGASADDPSTERLNHPTNVVFDPMAPPGEMIIAAWHNSLIKKVTLDTGDIVDICGTGKRGFGGNGGPAIMAILDLPVAVAFDPTGNMLIADQANQMIRKVDRTTDTITTIAGTGHCADAVNPNPCVLNDGGPATMAGFHFPIGQAAAPGGRIAVGADGSIYVADTENFRLRRIDPAGMISTVAGNGSWGYAGDGGPATDAKLGRLSDVAIGPDGRIYIADTDNDCVRVVTTDGTISTFAGQCAKRGFGGDQGPATLAQLNRPYGVAIGPSGELFIADTHNNRVRVVGP